jgi:hypothetical protein
MAGRAAIPCAAAGGDTRCSEVELLFEDLDGDLLRDFILAVQRQ